MTKLELLRKLHDEINAIGGVAYSEFDEGINFAVNQALPMIEREILAEEREVACLMQAAQVSYNDFMSSQVEV